MKIIIALAVMLALCLPLSLRAQVTANPAVRAILPSPPKTISPAPGESRSMEQPLTFRWAPVFLGNGRQASYRLVITPIFSDQTAADALEQNQPLFSRIVSDPSFEYEPGSPSFRLYPMAVGFAWQVQAVDTGGHPVASNLGKSEVSSFNIANKLMPPVVTKLIPETLIAGTFRIDVEEYDQPSKSLNPKLPSGIGRVKFTCPPLVLPFPWKNVRPVMKTYSVVQSVTDSLTQVHIADALLLNPSVRVGDRLPISLPQRSEVSQTLIDRNLVIGLLKGLKGPQGIRVRFRDVEWTGALAPVVVLSEGIAWYPTAPAVPAVPAQIGIDPGFSLAIDSLVITPARASVRGAILLPPCIVSATGCTRSSLGLPWTNITGQCELYREVPDSSFGPFYVGETGIQVSGKGYTLDFSSTHSDPSVIPSLGNPWKGVVLKAGTTPDPPAEIVLSNRGYLKAKYGFANGLIVSSGLEARLDLASPFAFRTVEPMGYLVVMRPPDGFLRLGACGVQGGQFLSGEIHLPLAAIRDDNGALIRARYDTLHVQNDMDLFGAVKVPGGFTWGEFSKTEQWPRFYQLRPDPSGTSAEGYFYLAARQLPPYYPLVGNIFTPPALSFPEVQLESQGMQGITLTLIGHREFTIWTQDVPGGNNPFPANLSFAAETVFPVWMNIIGTGVHTEVRVAKYIDQSNPVNLGPTWSTNPRYLGETPFRVSFKSDQESKQRLMRMQFVESATWYSDFNGKISLGGPINGTVAFTNLTFTSTANAGGAQLDLTQPLNMDYWGVTAVPKDSTKSAGIVCVKLGVIYLTAAGIFEPRHFAAPFWLTWGELKASGNMGRLFFDYNGGGQKFDRFPYTPSLVKLSDYRPTAPTDSGFVITYGTLAFNFFGAKPLWVYDWKSVGRPGDPFGGRTVRIPMSTPYGTGGTDLHLLRNWGDGVADLNFTVMYDSLVQDGFAGPGSASINKFVVFSAPLPGGINVKAERSCFSLNHETDVTIALAPLMTTSALSKVWGCGCIVGENLERVAVGGELSANNGAGFSIVARSAGVVSVVMGFSPSRTDFLFAGDAFVVLLTANAEVVGYVTLTIDRDVGYAEGYAKGIVTMDAIVAGLSGEGEFQWHVGTDNETIQGRVAVSMYGMGWPAVGAGLEAGLWFGINSNKDNVWVMDGISGRFGLNKAALPQYITGLYAYMSFSASVSYYVVSGGYQAYAGVGAFAGYGQNTGAGFGVIGNVGLYVWGKILGGLVSADAWGDLQMIIGVPPAFQGTLGLDACVLWVFCGSVSVNAGFNANQGFYLY
jgi:hypothetical protein